MSASAALVLLGCSSHDSATDANPPVDGQDETTTEPDSAAAQDEEDTAGNSTAGTDGAPAADGDEAEADEESTRLGTVEVDETREHPTNTEVTVTERTVEPNAVYVGLEAVNGSSEEISLALDADVFIRLLAGDRRLAYRPPEDNPSLDIPPGGEMTARLAFTGRVGADADTLDLLLNWGKDGPLNPDGEFGDTPSFEFRDLPLPEAS